MSLRSQDFWVDTALSAMRDGFVVESGGFDGLSGSNSLHFEVVRGWKCLLVEPNPLLQEKILKLHRKCTLLRAGISPTGSAGSFSFEPAGSIGGLTQAVNRKRIENQRGTHGREAGWGSAGKSVMVPTFPLQHVLRALGRSVVDYWSLDLEGPEVPILNATDFEAITVGLITVEHQCFGAPQPHTL